MFALFEDTGKFVAGRILSQADTSAQIELDSGKRVKVKAAQLLLSFSQPQPAQLLDQAATLSKEIDVQLLWEFAPEDEFSFQDVAKDYFQDPASLEQQVATLLALFGAPHYFRRAGSNKGRYKKAPAEIVQQALLAIEKKQQLQAQIDTWAQELANAQCPQAIQEQLYKILFKPDKNAAEYKAVVQATKSTQQAPLDLLQKAGAITSPYEFHWQRFLFEFFPKGIAFPTLQAPAIDTNALAQSDVQAFSIDDSSTTEIDDALSVSGLGTGTVTLGIHIAAPGLAIQPGDAIDTVARNRLSTVYMPGYKITMLPDEIVQHYSLNAGQAVPTVTLYASFDETTLALNSVHSSIERTYIAHNLRIEALQPIVTADWLNAPADTAEADPALQQHRPALAFMWRLAQHLKSQREQVRGKPETFSRPEYSFKLLRDTALKNSPPTGEEDVQISSRLRGSPLDMLVSESMIFANHHWGQMLADKHLPGIYRSQAALAPGIKVRMSTKALPHAGIGVACYAWNTSPLRRYVDLVNQWQIIACIRHGATAALLAPFKNKDAALFGIISAFDATYTGYNAYQASMERFWTLQHLQRQGITELTAHTVNANLVRFDEWPLTIRVIGAETLPRNAQVRVRLGTIDLMMLDVSGTVIARLDEADAAPEAEIDDEDSETMVAEPLSIAVTIEENTTPIHTAA